MLANITIDYLKPITLYDSIEVFTRIYEMGTKSLKMGQEIVNRVSKEVYTTSSRCWFASATPVDFPSRSLYFGGRELLILRKKA